MARRTATNLDASHARFFQLAVAAAFVPVCGYATAHVAAVPGVPPISDAARAAGFIDVRTVVPDAVIDLRYATSNNFTRTQL